MIKNKVKPILITIVVLAIVGGVVFTQKKESAVPAVTATPTTSEPGPVSGKNNAPVANIYTLTQVAAHKDASSCWSAVNGNVYDLTAWISQHPGGERAILGICGKDGSAAFNKQHGDAKKQADILATFKIGSLSQ